MGRAIYYSEFLVLFAGMYIPYHVKVLTRNLAGCGGMLVERDCFSQEGGTYIAPTKKLT